MCERGRQFVTVHARVYVCARSCVYVPVCAYIACVCVCERLCGLFTFCYLSCPGEAVNAQLNLLSLLALVTVAPLTKNGQYLSNPFPVIGKDCTYALCNGWSWTHGAQTKEEGMFR